MPSDQNNVTVPKSSVIALLIIALGSGGALVKAQHATDKKVGEQAVELRGIGKQLDAMAVTGPRYTKELADRDNAIQTRELEGTIRESLLPLTRSMAELEGSLGVVADVLNKMHAQDVLDRDQ